jgi:NTE family protein
MASDGAPSVAVVISAGGIKPLAAIPILHMLAEERIPISFLAGSSGGALVAALAATGCDTAEMPALCQSVLRADLFKPLHWRRALGLLGIPGGRPLGHTEGLIDPTRIRQALATIYRDQRIETTATPLAINVTDHMTGNPVMLTEGPLEAAVYGSVALWPMLPPCHVDGRWYSDGGYSVAIPIIEAWRRGADIIIAIENNEFLRRPQRNFFSRYSTFQTAMRHHIGRSVALLGTSLHHGELIVIDLQFPRPIDFDDVDSLKLILEVGRQHAEQYRARIVAEVRGG